jgi:flagellar basal-body rod protein FlgC
MDFFRTLAIAASGLKAQSSRMRIISENIANADSTATRPGSDPYRRKIPVFESEVDRALNVQLVEMGKVQNPNVNPLLEMTDMREAQRSYEANINVISATRRMLQRTIDILKA